MSELTTEANLSNIPHGVPIIVVENISKLSEDKSYGALSVFTASDKVLSDDGTFPLNKSSNHNRMLYPVKLDSIEIGSFMPHFAYFEALTTAILAMHHAHNITEYYEQWRLITDGGISLYRRTVLVEELRKKLYADGTSKTRGIQELCNVRNHLVHTLLPLTVEYRGKYYSVRDEDNKLKSLLAEDLTKEIYNLFKIYAIIQDNKLRVWLTRSS